MMTKRSVWTLEQNERDACTVLSKMVSADNVVFDKCETNDQIYVRAKELLHGEDPIEFAIEVLTDMYGSWMEKSFRDQYMNYLG